ncbi:hypothetical protein EFV65_17540 [Yersinia enterocolitica]|nr:hypothetical protein [Yersinia enterocolitica]
MFAGKKSAQIREILISESAWEEMTCLFAPSLAIHTISLLNIISRTQSENTSVNRRHRFSGRSCARKAIVGKLRF